MAHAGRPGVVAGVVRGTVEAMRAARRRRRSTPGSARMCAGAATKCPARCATRSPPWLRRRTPARRGALRRSTSAPRSSASSPQPAARCTTSLSARASRRPLLAPPRRCERRPVRRGSSYAGSRPHELSRDRRDEIARGLDDGAQPDRRRQPRRPVGDADDVTLVVVTKTWPVSRPRDPARARRARPRREQAPGGRGEGGRAGRPRRRAGTSSGRSSPTRPPRSRRTPTSCTRSTPCGWRSGSNSGAHASERSVDCLIQVSLDPESEARAPRGSRRRPRSTSSPTRSRLPAGCVSAA